MTVREFLEPSPREGTPEYRYLDRDVMRPQNH
jgi:hypothetical protein